MARFDDIELVERSKGFVYDLAHWLDKRHWPIWIRVYIDTLDTRRKTVCEKCRDGH